MLGDVWVAAYESRAKYDRSYPEARPWLDGKPDLYYTLYTDKGQQFTGDSAKTLVDAVAKGDAEPASPYDGNVMAAARLAANGDVDKARIAMITASGNALGVGLSPAEAD
ncbi:hypothetical protein AB0L41_42205, partial [Amycolatopsis mediterranei]